MKKSLQRFLAKRVRQSKNLFKFLRVLLYDDELFEQALDDPKLRNRLLFSEPVLKRQYLDARFWQILSEHDEIWLKILPTDEAWQRLMDNPYFWKKFIAAPSTLQQILNNDQFRQQIVTDERLFSEILGNRNILNKILMNEHVIRTILSYKPLKSKVSFINAKQEAAQLPYDLPTYLLSFPRSGSNFLQSVLQGSSGLTCRSIYASLPEHPDIILSLKSHALSYDYLLDEIKRLIPEVVTPSKKLIVLFRDPRDVMISFYDLVQFERNMVIDQEEFLDVSYFFASRIDPNVRRGLDYKAIGIANAYKKFVQNWHVDKPNDLNYLMVKYEDLVETPLQAFERIFRFLELDITIVQELLEFKVSLYSKTRKQRGKAYGWHQSRDRYGTLIDHTEKVLASEIQTLGYDLSD